MVYGFECDKFRKKTCTKKSRTSVGTVFHAILYYRYLLFIWEIGEQIFQTLRGSLYDPGVSWHVMDGGMILLC